MAYEESGKEEPKRKNRKAGEKMDEQELQQLMHGIITSAVQYTEDELTPERAKATAYYKGERLGNEEEGRSQVVMTEVRDAVIGLLPSMLRVIFGPERVVEFQPKTKEKVEQAAQITDFVQNVFVEKCNGFLRSYSVIKDGLVRKLGVFKYGWAEEAKKTTHRLENVTEEQAVELLGQPGVDVQRAEQNEDGTLNIELTHTAEEGEPWVCEVPPEEFIFTPEARDKDTALGVFHRRELTTSELLALGVSQEDIDEHGGLSRALKDNEEAIERRLNENMIDDPEAGESNDKHLYVEGYVRVDYDGDGENELRKVCTLGAGHYVVNNEPAPRVPFVVYCPDPEPHTMVGQSYADRLMDLQRTKSAVVRATLDSLAAAIFPRIAIQNGQVNIQDALNTEIGAPIRTNVPPSQAILPVITPFVGKEAFPVIQYLDETAERRTGRNKGAEGLDADALQSTTAQGVGAAITSSQEQAELAVRLFAEQALKPLFKGLYELFVEYQPRAQTVQLRGRWVEIDPSQWDADMNVTVKVALGADKERKLAVLRETKATQEAILQMVGPDNPLVTLAQYRNTLEDMLTLEGRLDVERYFNVIPPDWKPPAPQQPQQPDPTTMLAQAQLEVERMRTQRELAIKEAELELKRQQLALQDDRERDKQAADIALRMKELELKYTAQVDQAQMNAQIEQIRMTTQAEGMRQAAEINAAAQVHAAETNADVEREKAAVQAHVDRQKHAEQAAVAREKNTQAARKQGE